MPGSHSKKDKLKKKVRKARKTVVRDKTNEGYEPTKLKGKKRIPPSRVSPNWAVTKKSYPTSDYQRKVEYEQDKELGEDAVSVSESNAKKYSKLKKRIAKIGKDTRRKNFEKAIKEPHERVVHTMDNFNIEDLKTPKGKKTLEKVRKLNKDAKVRKAATRDDPSTPLLKEVPFGKDTRRKSQKEVDKEHLEFATSPMNTQITHETKDWELGKPSQVDRKRIIKARLAKIRKADQQDINRVKRWNSKSFNKKKELSGPTEPVFKTTADLRNRLAKLRKANGGIAPNYNNPSKVRKKKTATKAAGLGALGEGKLNKYTGKPMKLKPRKRILDEFPSEKQIDEKQRKRREKTALRSAVNKGVNKVNPIKPTKKYKTKPPQGPNPNAETPEAIRKTAEIAGRKNDTYIGKRIARIRKAGEQVDPRVKKRKTVRPDSPVQKVALNKRRIPPSRVYSPAYQKKQEDSLYSPLAKSVREKRLKTEKPLDVDSGYNRKTKKLEESPKAMFWTKEDIEQQNMAKMKDRIAELKTAKDHSHSIAFRKHEGQYYRRASLAKQEGKYAKYWLLNAKQTNGNGWGVSPVSIAKNINKFIGRPFVVTAKQWIPESEYGDQFEHPYLPTNNIDNIINHQEKFRVGSIVDVVEKDGDYHAVIEINSKFANMMLPPFCSPAIFQNNPGEADGEISDWEALHLAGLMEDPAYGARIALLKGSCMGTADACSIQFKAAKQTTMCPKKKAKLVRRIDRLGD